MTVRTDPEGNETEPLFDLVRLDDREVLEIGCGDGRLTWRYADRAAHVTAIDPFEDGIARARQQLPATLASRVDLRAVAFEDFAPVTKASTFDIVILAGPSVEWSPGAWSMPWRRSTGCYGPAAR